MRGKSLWIFSLGVQLHYAINQLKKFRKLLDWTRKGLFAPFTLSPLLCCGAAFHSLDKSGKTPAAEPAAGGFLREKEEKMKNTNRFQKILLPMLRFSGAPTSSVPLEYRKCCVWWWTVCKRTMKNSLKNGPRSRKMWIFCGNGPEKAPDTTFYIVKSLLRCYNSGKR